MITWLFLLRSPWLSGLLLRIVCFILRIHLLTLGCLGHLLWSFILLEDIIIIHGELSVHSCNRFRQLRNKLSGSSPIHCKWWNYSLRRDDGVVQYFYIVVNLHSVSNYTVFSYLNIFPNLQCTNDAVFVNVDIIPNSHFSIFESTLLLGIAWSDDTFFSYNGIHSHWYLS